MDQKRNYGRECEEIIGRAQRENTVPRLLLHACCAPCSSHVLEYLREYFDITVYYYNPNITSAEEYEKRLAEEKRLIAACNRQIETGDFTDMHSTAAARPIGFLAAPYDPESFEAIAKGRENCPEGGERCTACFALRLGKTAEAAAAGGYDYFTTTLTISPLKDASRLNEIGARLAQEKQVKFLPSDFKKKDGYQRSIELSRKFGLYRQNYCGCEYSKREAEQRITT